MSVVLDLCLEVTDLYHTAIHVPWKPAAKWHVCQSEYQAYVFVFIVILFNDAISTSSTRHDMAETLLIWR